MSDRAGEYIVGLFGAEDELLASLREEADRTGLPPIAISSDEGRLLQVLLTAINARRVLEVGTLGGYSAICRADDCCRSKSRRNMPHLRASTSIARR
jgi:predicted O-methyltransferase YrrM